MGRILYMQGTCMSKIHLLDLAFWLRMLHHVIPSRVAGAMDPWLILKAINDRRVATEGRCHPCPPELAAKPGWRRPRSRCDAGPQCRPPPTSYTLLGPLLALKSGRSDQGRAPLDSREACDAARTSIVPCHSKLRPPLRRHLLQCGGHGSVTTLGLGIHLSGQPVQAGGAHHIGQAPQVRSHSRTAGLKRIVRT